MKTKGLPARRIGCCRLHLVWACLLALVAAGCTAATDTARLHEVAEAGVAYADKVPRLLDRAFELAVAVDSGALVAARSGLSEDRRRKMLQEFDAVMAERLEEYVAARRHNELLRSYFLALRTLLEPDGPKGIEASAKRLTAELGKLSPRLKKARMGDVPVSDLIEPAAGFVVGSFKSAVLRRETEARGQVIERELALQEALVTALARQVRADGEALSVRFRHDEVMEPYVNAKRLPGTWSARRLRSLRDGVDVDVARAAERAVRSLRKAYVAAMEARLDHARAAELAATVEDFVKLVSRLGAGTGRAVR